MKQALKSIIVILTFSTITLSAFAVAPYVQEKNIQLQKYRKDCIGTNPEKRTPTQAEFCEKQDNLPSARA